MAHGQNDNSFHRLPPNSWINPIFLKLGFFGPGIVLHYAGNTKIFEEKTT